MSDYGTLISGGSLSGSALSRHPGYVSGRFYTPANQGPPAAGVAATANSMTLGFGSIERTIMIAKLGARVTTLSAGGLFQLGIYKHNADTAKPGLLVANTVSGSTDAVALVDAALVSPTTLEAGDYWFALQLDNTVAVMMAQGLAASNHTSRIGSATGAIGSAIGSQPAGYSRPATFGVWPADIGALNFTEISSRVPLIQFQVA